MVQLALIIILMAMPAKASSAASLEVVSQDQEAKRALEEKGVSYNEGSFIEAARRGDNEIVKLFLDAGMDANLRDQRDEERSTILMVAAMAGRTETVSLLLGHGAQIDAKTKKGRTALTWASWRGMIDTVKALVDSGAALNSADKIGGTPLGFAISKGHTATVQFLLDRGADCETRQKGTEVTPLMEAVIHGNTDIVNALLKKGANLNVRDHVGRTALDWAGRTHRPDLEVLLRRAAINKP